MNEISCPECGKAFKIDEAGYANIIKQVRDSEFEKQIHERLELAEQEKLNAVELAKIQISNEIQKNVTAKDSEIQELKAKLDANVTEQELAINKALSELEKERDILKNEIDQMKQEKESAVQLTKANLEKENQETIASKEKEIQDLKAQLGAKGIEQELAVTKAVNEAEKERDELKNNLNKVELEKELEEKALKEKYETQLKDRDDMIERLKDLKAKLSTKMVGETLELHCETEFNQIRAAAFPLAYFEKDNDAKSGSKGDYIFRDYDENKTDIVSIMFEMKNESDTTSTKKKNEDFLKELDKDRTEKDCEYAILVSLLEPKANCTTLVLLICRIDTQRCM